MLASGSRYRAQVLADAGIDVEIVEPTVDERALDHRFDPMDPGAHAVRLAVAKADSVMGRVPSGSLVIAGDQLGVLDGSLLHQPGTAARAVDQLLSMSATTHLLVNGIVVTDVATGQRQTAVDVHRVTMRRFDRAEAEAYVRDFEPLDSVGGYRIEDDVDFIDSVEGSGPDGVMGMPIELLRRLIDRASS